MNFCVKKLLYQNINQKTHFANAVSNKLGTVLQLKRPFIRRLTRLKNWFKTSTTQVLFEKKRVDC